MKLAPRYGTSEFLAVDGRPDDQRTVVTRQRRRLEENLAGLDADAWASASRCDGWTIQDVVAHLVGVNGFWEASVAAGLAGAPTRILERFDPAAHPPLIIEPMRGLTPHEVLGQFVASNDGFLGALAVLDDDGWSTLAESPAGHVSIRMLAAHALWDAWVHERDVMIPLGVAPTEEPDEVAASLRYAAAVGPVLALGASDAFVGDLGVVAGDPDVSFTLTISDAVHVRDVPPVGLPCLSGPAVDLVEALSVRAPMPVGAPDEWHRHARCLATVFDVSGRT